VRTSPRFRAGRGGNRGDGPQGRPPLDAAASQEVVDIRLFRAERRQSLMRQLQSERTRALTQRAVERGRRARIELLILAPMIAGVVYAYQHREELFGLDVEIRIAAVFAMVALGLAVTRALGRALEPWMARRVDPGTAGTLGFLVRLFALVFALIVALRLAGLRPATLAVGGAFTAVVLGLAAQQTLGNLFAGLVLLSTRPFRVGDRVRLQAGGLAGQIEGDVRSLGLLYVTLSDGLDPIMVPNSMVLTAAIVPLREPASVDLRARLRRNVRPTHLEALIEESITIPLRSDPHISLEEIDDDGVVMRIAATPQDNANGPRLADEILAAIAGMTRESEASRDECSDDGRRDGSNGRSAEREAQRVTTQTDG
jgi:small conductance mechanosensitive channel